MDIFSDFSPTPLNWIDFCYAGETLQIGLKRDDLPCPLRGGNKFRKLRYHPLFVHPESGAEVVSVGGGYSNFVIALTLLCVDVGCKPHFITNHRGEDSWLMQFCKEAGAAFYSTSNSRLRVWRKVGFNPGEISEKLNDCIRIPEGGGGKWSERGVAEMVEEIKAQVTGQSFHLLVGAGTGTTCRFILKYLPPTWKLSAYPGVRGVPFREFLEEMAKEVGRSESFSLLNIELDRGIGFISEEEAGLIELFYQQTGVLLDPFYSGKALVAWVRSDDRKLPAILIHSGGIQAWIGLAQHSRSQVVRKLGAIATDKLRKVKVDLFL
ncbi:MAG: pyridoxal-phosphate dependent enzyme [Saprospirales bacterium]|nr:MAG: pyridoxal-phosphate dependent enzyme [Saprospirales bacterium]